MFQDKGQPSSNKVVFASDDEDAGPEADNTGHNLTTVVGGQAKTLEVNSLDRIHYQWVSAPCDVQYVPRNMLMVHTFPVDMQRINNVVFTSCVLWVVVFCYC